MRKRLRHVRHLHLANHYRAIEKIETKLGPDLVAAELRRNFTAESFATIDKAQKAKGMTRQQRRHSKRQVVKAK
jgi:hypothetical protein